MMSFPTRIDNPEVAQRILSEVDYVVTDCDGVLWLNTDIIPGTKEIINRLRKCGKKIIFATNNSSKSREDIKAKLNKMGFEAQVEEIMITSFALVVYLKRLNFQGTVYVFGSRGVKDELDRAGIKNVGYGEDPTPKTDAQVPEVTLDPNVNAVVVTYDSNISLAKLIKACTYAKRVPDNLFIATNTDEVYPTNMKHLVVPGTGAFVSFVQTAVKRKPIILGKPGAFFFDCIKAVLPDIKPERTLMIGDRLRSDIAFGNINGFRYTILVQTGVDTLEDVKECLMNNERDLVPSHYIKSLADLSSCC